MNLLRGLLSLDTAARTSLVEDSAVSLQHKQNGIRRTYEQRGRSVLVHIICGVASVTICCLLFVTEPLAHAQSTFGSVRGNVQDASGSAIPGAEIVLHSTDENTERTVDTDTSGAFIFENVKAGKYTLRAHRDGFADTVVSGISVEARQDLRLEATLNIAAQMTTVEVSGAADQINTENGTIGDSKTNIEMTQLPLNNRATTP